MNGQGQAFHSGDSGLHPLLIHVWWWRWCWKDKLTGRTTPQSVWKTQRGRNDWGGWWGCEARVCAGWRDEQSDDFPPRRDSSVGGMTDDAEKEEGGEGGGGRRSSDGWLAAVGQGAGRHSSSPRPRGGAGEGVDLVSSLLGDASLLLGQGHELGMDHEIVDGATGLWALQPLVQGATECVHHLNLKQRQRKKNNYFMTVWCQTGSRGWWDTWWSCIWIWAGRCKTTKHKPLKKTKQKKTGWMDGEENKTHNTSTHKRSKIKVNMMLDAAEGKKTNCN